MAEKHTAAEFTEMFDKLFAEHDSNKNGALEIDEARNFMTAVNAARPDGQEFDEARFQELFAAKSTDGKIAKEVCHALMLKRAQTLGFVSE